MMFLDSNVFLYAIGADHPHRSACASLLERLGRGEVEATTNTEVLQEVLFVLERRSRRAAAIEYGRNIMRLFRELLPVTHHEMALACGLLARYPRLSVRDAVHAATMLQNGIKQIVSFDPDFDTIAEIKRLDPGAV
jgi:predicted nucleic acid-binding protein